jgi:hypothetical protein
MISNATGDKKQGRRHTSGRDQCTVNSPLHGAARRTPGPDRSTHDEKNIVPMQTVRPYSS